MPESIQLWPLADLHFACTAWSDIGIRMTASPDTYILKLSCRDTVGIVAAISGHLAKICGFIVNSQQYADLESGLFFLRIEFAAHGEGFPASV